MRYRRFCFKKSFFREKDPRDPVVFVHGVTDWTAGYDPVFKKFLSLGYLESELYGITYGFAWDANIYTESMKCEYAKQVLFHKNFFFC